VRAKASTGNGQWYGRDQEKIEVRPSSYGFNLLNVITREVAVGCWKTPNVLVINSSAGLGDRRSSCALGRELAAIARRSNSARESIRSSRVWDNSHPTPQQLQSGGPEESRQVCAGEGDRGSDFWNRTFLLLRAARSLLPLNALDAVIVGVSFVQLPAFKVV